MQFGYSYFDDEEVHIYNENRFSWCGIRLCTPLRNLEMPPKNLCEKCHGLVRFLLGA